MRHRRSKLFAFALVLAAAIGGAGAQEFAFGWNPRTGDDWVDERLADINGYGYRYREAFIDEIVRYYGAPRDLVFELVVDRRWAPGDVYYACAIARIVGRPCRYVVDAWNRDHGQGWGEVAKRLGIEPGSDEFHRLKRGFVPSYDRWNRPVELDTELRRAYPDRKDRPYAWSGKEDGKGRAGADVSQDKGKPARSANGRGKGRTKGTD